MAAVGAFAYRLPGTLCQPQETTAILIAGAVAAVTAGPLAVSPALGPTVAVLAPFATAVTGLFAYLCGRFRLGNVARFMPYPVLGGFLAASGYVLVAGAIGLVLGIHLDIWRVAAQVAPGAVTRWLPWMLVAVGMVVLLRRVRHEMALPVAMAAITVGFYGWLYLTGTSLSVAEEAGLLLGPFPDGDARLPNAAALLVDADWRAILSQSPTILAIAGLTVLGTLLNTSGLELAMDRRTDINRDLGTTGIVNLVAAAGGGMPGYPMIGETLLGVRLGLRGATAGLAVATVCGLAAVYGVAVLGILPTRPSYSAMFFKISTMSRG
jgi:SulP family sulfate permease